MQHFAKESQGIVAFFDQERFDGMDGREAPIHVDRSFFVPEQCKQVFARVRPPLHDHGDFFEKLDDMVRFDFGQHGGVAMPPEVMAVEDLFALGMGVGFRHVLIDIWYGFRTSSMIPWSMTPYNRQLPRILLLLSDQDGDKRPISLSSSHFWQSDSFRKS